MWPYWMLFLLLAAGVLSESQQRGPIAQGAPLRGPWLAAFVLTTLMVGLRHEVGGDWFTYLEKLDLVAYDSLMETLTQSDPAYGLLNWVAAEAGLGVYFVNSVCAALFTWGLLVFCRAQPNPWLALVVAVPYLITVVAMGYTRQGVAIGLVMLGLVALDQGRVLRFLFWVSFAATFHKSAVILLPLAALVGTRNRFFLLLLVGIVTGLLFTYLLQDSVEDLRTNYIEAAYQSSGAAIRVAMNAVPAVLFLMLRKRFQLRPEQRIFWTWMALGGIGFVVLLQVSPSSTAVDRVALYWIPLQLFVLSRLPNALGRPDKASPGWVYGVVGYSAAVLFVWLFYAQTAFAWLPYQFYPWVLLWD